MKNVQNKVPSTLLLIVLVGFPQISESIFTPVLPAISQALTIPAATSQLMMGSYFVGFAVGVLFWGRLSDRIGRRPAMLWGIVVYLFGNVGLWLAADFTWLLMARGLQAFGAAAGSVVTQTMMREAFSGITGERIFAQVSAAMALAPALGPLIGGALQTYYGDYHSVFAGLITMAVTVWLAALLRLPETIAAPSVRRRLPWPTIARRMLRCPSVWVYCLLISGINGILFSYYAEAPFIFEREFGLNAVQYGWLGLVIASASIAGAVATNYLATRRSAPTIINGGLLLALFGAIGMLGTAHHLGLSLAMIFTMFCGLYTALPLVLNRALIGFEDVIGTASGLLSFCYYLAISAFTFLMSRMHDGTVDALPRFALLVTTAMVVASLIEACRQARR